MNKVLEVKNINKTYKIYDNNFDRLKEVFTNKSYHKEFIANKNISFDLFEGETLGIIGVNGAGKSTLLKQIAGVTVPTSGNIIRHGRVTALLELGTGFNPELTGYENIFMNGTLIGMTHTECEQKAKDIITFSELGDYIYEPIKTYSSGMRMRLAFSIAIFSEPQILIVDEALSVGDAHFGAKCTKALRERKEKHMSIIYVSHDLNSLKLLCDRVILLNDGEVVKIGSPEDVINSYNYFIALLNEKNDNGFKLIKKTSNSHGTYEAEIINVSITGLESKSNVISSGEEAVINIDIKSNIDIDNVSVGIAIRDKFGQSIFGARSFDYSVHCSLQKDELYRLQYKQRMDIGPGKYTISSAIHYDVNGINRRLYWKDNAENFEIAGIKGSLFSGLCKLYPSVTLAKKTLSDTLLVTTSKSFLSVDLKTESIKVLHQGQGLYYGITFDENYIYVGARNRLLSSSIDRSEEKGSILKFDKSLNYIEEITSPFPLRDIHQIQIIDKKIYITCSYDNLIAIYDGVNWEQWYPNEYKSEDKNHFNSINHDENYIYLLAHNFGASEVYMFEKNSKKLVNRQYIGQSAHNLWFDKDVLHTLSSEESKLVNINDDTALTLEGFPRGIVATNENMYIGISQRVERDQRDFVDGKIVIYNNNIKISDFVLKSEGMVLDIKVCNNFDYVLNEYLDTKVKE